MLSILADINGDACAATGVSTCAKVGLDAFKTSMPGEILSGFFAVAGFCFVIFMIARFLSKVGKDTAKAVQNILIALVVAPFLFDIWLVVQLIDLGGTVAQDMIDFVSKMVNPGK